MNAASSDVVRATRGPLMLITLGTLIAVDHFGMLSFTTTWPVLVIVFGVLKLAERMLREPAYAQPYPNPQAPYPQQPPFPGNPGVNAPAAPPPPPGGFRS